MVHYIETEHRRISTPIPHPKDLELLEELRKVESDAVPKQLPIWAMADGHQVWDFHNNQFIDFTSGIFVANIGHGNERVRQAISCKRMFHTYLFVNEHRLRFIQKLIEITPAFAEKACLFSAGTEATEAAVKIMRGWGWKHHRTAAILSVQGAMHGNSYLAKRLGGWCLDWISAEDEIYYLGGRKDYKIDYSQVNNDIQNAFMHQRDGKLCGVIIESYQGWSARFFPQSYIQNIVEMARSYGMLVCFDEIQGGFGRTGKMFAYEHYDVEPDLVCLGKGLTGSLPVSAVIGRAKYMDCLPKGELSSTHSGNPVGCAAGLANLEEFSKDNFKIVDESQQKGEVLHDRLNELKDKYPEFIVEINGKGLLAAIITKTKEQSDKVCELAKQRGLLLVHTGRESIKIGPPLTITTDALLEGIEVIAECFGELKND